MRSSTSSTYLRAFQRARPAITRGTVQITSREPVPTRSSGSVMPVPPSNYCLASTSRPPLRRHLYQRALHGIKRCFVQGLGIVRNMSHTRPPATTIAGVWGRFPIGTMERRRCRASSPEPGSREPWFGYPPLTQSKTSTRPPAGQLVRASAAPRTPAGAPRTNRRTRASCQAGT